MDKHCSEKLKDALYMFLDQGEGNPTSIACIYNEKCVCAVCKKYYTPGDAKHVNVKWVYIITTFFLA
jgi:hypothetical protein